MKAPVKTEMKSTNTRTIGDRFIESRYEQMNANTEHIKKVTLDKLTTQSTLAAVN